MKTKLVEITSDDSGWKGTWYRKGERHFVQQDEAWPKVVLNRWRALDVSGGIHECDCRIVRGPVAWVRCALRAMRHNTGANPRRRLGASHTRLPRSGVGLSELL